MSKVDINILKQLRDQSGASFAGGFLEKYIDNN